MRRRRLSCLAVFWIFFLATPEVKSITVLPCSKVPAVWALLPLPSNQPDDFSRALGRLAQSNWRKVQQELQQLNGRRFTQMQAFKYLRVSNTIARALRQRYGKEITANNNRAGCRPPTRPARIVVPHTTTTIGKFFSQLGIRSAAAFSVVAKEAEVFNPGINFASPDATLVKGTLVFLPQSFPFNPKLLQQMPQIKPEVDEQEVTDTQDRGGISFAVYGGYKRGVARGLDTESSAVARAISEVGTHLSISVGIDLDSGPGLLLARATVNRESFAYSDTSENDTEVDKTKVPDSAMFGALELGWSPDNPGIYLGVEASQRTLMIVRRDDTRLTHLDYFVVNAFGPVFGVSRGDPRGWSFSALASPHGYTGSGELELELEPGYELQFVANYYQSASTSYAIRAKIAKVSASEPGFTHEYPSYLLEFGVLFF